MSLITKMHEMYKNDNVTIDILKAVEKSLLELEDSINDIERQRLLNFTTWYLNIFEAELGITSKSDTFEKRCDEVRRKLLTRGKVSIDGVREIVKNYTDFYMVEFLPEEYTVNVTSDKEISGAELSKLQQELREYVPAHIYINYSNYARTHVELEEFTHEFLSGFTHQEITDEGVLV